MKIPNVNLIDLATRLESLERVVYELASMDRDLLSPDTAKWLSDHAPKGQLPLPFIEPGRPLAQQSTDLDPVLQRAMDAFDQMFEPSIKDIIKLERGE